MTDHPGGPWFARVAPRPAAPATLFCLPHAGGAPSTYRQWSALAPDLDVAAVSLPGRGQRWGEPAEVDVAALATAVAAEAGARPYALYGHSMGAWLGFEVARELRRSGAPVPVRMYLGGSRPPHARAALYGLSDIPDSDLIDQLLAYGGMPREVAEEPELCRLVLPAVRGDLRWMDARTHTDEAPLQVPLRLFAGAGDPITTPAELFGWMAHTSVGVRLRTMPGGHFFHQDDPARLVAAIRADLATALRSIAGSEQPGDAGGPSQSGWPDLPAPDEVRLWLDTGEARPAALSPQVTVSRSGSAGWTLTAAAYGHDVGVGLRHVDEPAAPGELDPDERTDLDSRTGLDRLGHGLALSAARRALQRAAGAEAVAPRTVSFAGCSGRVWRPRVAHQPSGLSDWRVSLLTFPRGAGGISAVAAVAQRRDRWRLRFAAEPVPADCA
ncbi:MAG: thioesterase II family protein [Micromonosporaceae bacterium]